MGKEERWYKKPGFIGGLTAHDWIDRIARTEGMPPEDARLHFEARVADGRLVEAET